MSVEQYRREVRWMYQQATGMPLRTGPPSKLEYVLVGLWALFMLGVIGFMFYKGFESFYLEFVL